PGRSNTVQAYLNDPSMKEFILRLIHEEHQGLPPIKWPDDPASTGVDYEGQLGIPMTVAVVAHAIWRGAGQAYAHTWPARFFDTMQPGRDCSVAGWRGLAGFLAVRCFPGGVARPWEELAEGLLALPPADPFRP